MRYAIVIERREGNYSAYASDVPGCAAVGDTLDEVKREFAEALQFHFEGLREEGQPIPVPTSMVDYVEVPDSPEEVVMEEARTVDR